MAAAQANRAYSDAEMIYNYHRMNMPLHQPADAIFCLCSLDTRVAERAAQLLLDGFAGDDGILIFSGGSGKLTEARFSEPEAEVFAAVARRMGVPAGRILVEPRSSNTGENVRFTRALLRDRGLDPRSFILVQKPYMERRTYATFVKQWSCSKAGDVEGEEGAEGGGLQQRQQQQKQPAFTVTSPQMTFAEYPDQDNPRDMVISIMVGDLVRIREYPARGFQISQDIPDEVWEAGQRLIQEGYNTHLP
ncbi:uncharacterized protein PpBr36_06636 [Pyricularia pennisetigena]|uniref:uncharacterized protein n=1 Tax=Pyricularia pennisetigena TaxID=1578925 RepID=UPI00114DDE5C|nr:uncharacterized protein PpBr36_06636 [Pyricularia pennisetigena]TLS23111.1 hypothetical protein PpBr36_06636 [Pyricularia pennisetigena]